MRPVPGTKLQKDIVTVVVAVVVVRIVVVVGEVVVVAVVDVVAVAVVVVAVVVVVNIGIVGVTKVCLNPETPWKNNIYNKNIDMVKIFNFTLKIIKNWTASCIF